MQLQGYHRCQFLTASLDQILQSANYVGMHTANAAALFCCVLHSACFQWLYSTAPGGVSERPYGSTLDHLLVQKDFGALCSLQSCSVVLQVKPRMVMAIKNRIAHQISFAMVVFSIVMAAILESKMF